MIYIHIDINTIVNIYKRIKLNYGLNWCEYT